MIGLRCGLGTAAGSTSAAAHVDAGLGGIARILACRKRVAQVLLADLLRPRAHLPRMFLALEGLELLIGNLPPLGREPEPVLVFWRGADPPVPDCLVGMLLGIVSNLTK